MAHNRKTLALIIICLPILATVITAFRVRDLPKAQESFKKSQRCDHCDVKVGHKVHGDKVESDSSESEELKKIIRQKQLVNQKPLDKSNHKYDVRSDEDDDEDDDLGFSNIQTGFRKEIPKVRKLEKAGPEKKVSFLKQKNYVNNDDEDDDDNDDDDEEGNISDKINVASKPKLAVVKKTNINLISTKNKIKDAEINNKENKSSADDDDDDEGDDDDENYDGLDNIEELFKILHMEKKTESKVKHDSEGKNKVLINKEIKPLVTKKSFVVDGGGKDHHDNDEDNNNNDDYDDDDDLNQINLSIKPPFKGSKIMVKEDEIQLKKTVTEDLKTSKLKDEHPKASHKPVKNPEKEDLKTKEQPKLSEIKRTTESSKKEGNIMNEIKQHPPVKATKDKEKSLDKPLPVVEKRDEPKPKDKVIDEKHEQESVQKLKEGKKETLKPKISHKQPESLGTLSSREQQKQTKDIKADKKESKRDESKDAGEKHEENKYVLQPKAKESETKGKTYFDEKLNNVHYEKPQLLSKIREKHSEEKLFDSDDTSTKSNLKHVTDALHRRNLLKSEFEDFYSFFPTFAPNFSRIHNPECRRHGQIVLRQLRGTKLWALNMLDATAKIPSGVLQGNGIQLGDFDQCIGSRARVKLDTGTVVKVQGQYCLARIDVKAEHPELEAPVYLAQAKSLIRSKIDDPGHFVPRFSTLSWGVCVPSACNPEDVEVILKDAVKHYQRTSGVILRVKVDEEDCYTEDEDRWEEWLELPTILTLSFYGLIILLVFVATVQDFIARRPNDESQKETDDQAECDQKTENEGEKKSSGKSSGSFLSSFSLYYTISKLTAPGTADEIACIHGIRAIATLALLLAHKFLPVAVMPFTNRVKITELASSPIWSWCRAGWVYTDCFLLLSGVLTAHRIASDGDTSAVKRLFSRYMRLTPALLAVVLFYAYVWDKLSAGPMWGTFVTKNSKVCQDGWWWNMLYVQNYFGFEDMCAPQTHQLALDMQLTILGGIIVWIVQSGQGIAQLILPGIHIGAAYLRYATVRDHRLTLLAYHGVSVSQLYRTARLSYMSTIHRCSPYLIGISLGLTLKKPAQHGKIVLILGWLTSGILWALVTWAGFESGSTEYRYSASFAAQYAAIAPIASAMAIAWVIYAVHNGTCEFLSQLLCWHPLVLISRLSYALYLCQFIIFITIVGTVKTSKEFTLASLVDVQELLAIILSSIILTLTFVIPMQSLHKVLYFQFKNYNPKTLEEDAVEPEPIAEIEEPKIEEIPEPQVPARTRQNFMAHREVLEEIPEMEVEYESQRDKNEGLDEILEEEEGTIGEEEDGMDNIDDLEIIEEEEAGEEDAWAVRDGERSISRNDDQDLDEWEWTTNGRSGAQYYRYAR